MYLLQKNNIHENPEKPLGNKGKDLEIMQLTTNGQNKVLLIDWYPQKTKSDHTQRQTVESLSTKAYNSICKYITSTRDESGLTFSREPDWGHKRKKKKRRLTSISDTPCRILGREINKMERGIRMVVKGKLPLKRKAIFLNPKEMS